MSFFSRKPNPPVPTAAVKAIAAAGSPKLQQAVQSMNSGLAAAQNAAQQAPKSEGEQAPSNARFRSFAERYIVERCRDWKEGEIDERAWATILEAKSIYNKVKEVGRTLTNDT